MKTIDGKLLGARILLDLGSNGLQKNPRQSERVRQLRPPGQQSDRLLDR
jgi:hypothetical protein